MKTGAMQSSGSGASGTRAQPRTVLLAEDMPALRQLYTHYLQKGGFRVLQADDGPVARSLVDSGAEIDLLVTDYHMPQMNGVDLAKWFHARCPGIPILLISATLEHVEIAAEALPFALCHMKPPLYDDFMALVERALDHRAVPPEPL